jgi:hypothetical protein
MEQPMALTPEPSQRKTNRRGSRRFPPRGRVKVTCRKGSLDLGPNLGVALLDASETGARLVLSVGLVFGQEVFLTLDSPTGGRPPRRLGTIVWTVAAADGTFLTGVQFAKPLRYTELSHVTHL